MPVQKKKSERRFEAIRDKVLARTGNDRISLKKAEEEAVQAYTVPRRKQPWEAQYEATRDIVLGRVRERAERVKEEIQRTGKLDLSKSAEDFDPFLVRAERYLGQPSLRKAAARDSRLYEAVDRARVRLALLKALEAGLSPYPRKVTKADLRKERLGLIEDMLCTWAVRRGLT